MNILGISGYTHESSVALIKDGRITALVEEERLNREKHTWKFPAMAIAKCLEIGMISYDDIDHVTFFLDPRLQVTGNIGHMLKYFPRSINLLTAPKTSNDLSYLSCLVSMATVERKLNQLYAPKKSTKVHYIEHHLGHAASAYYPSMFDEAAILTLDGRGESVTTLMSVGRQNTISKILEVKVPHSLGHLYATITDHLGFKAFFDEWKVMGMSAYGKDTYTSVFNDMVHLTKDGAFKLNLKYFEFHVKGKHQWGSKVLADALGPKRLDTDDYDQRHFDIAYGLQKIVEKTGVHLANSLYQKTKLPRLCLTGGVALNCLMNKRIVEETPFKDFFIQPIANDAGTSLGSALYFYHHVLGNKQRYPFDNIYLGPEFSNNEIEAILKSKGVCYQESHDIARDVARCVADGKVVGWFQGRMEAGPRALGNRSIIADPRSVTIKDRLNARVKRREFFRPFAPSILEEYESEYFRMPKGQKSPHMILVGDVHSNKRSIIPGVTHCDGTARVHTVSKRSNLKYWQLIDEFRKITGVPVLINTSFNENEPIVCTPVEAIDCYLRTDIDALAIGDFLITQKPS